MPAERPDAELTFAIDKGWQEPAPAGRSGISPERRFIDDTIAIVGIAGVMPQSADLSEYWDNLKNGRDMVTEIPRDRWIWEDVHGDPVKEINKSYSKWGGFMKEVDKFDSLFFGITPREAQMMDPQQRLFIETVWTAIEDSGHKVSDLSGTRTGLFVGVSSKDYIDVLSEHQTSLDGYSASGNSHSILANRISFLFNLRGPSAPIDTACSSSLIALHRAIESIHTGSSDMAIVGGVQVMLTSVAHISLSSAGMLSPDGKCKTFDKNANGYVRGEGVGAILIKRLSQAVADGNPIYAVIKATAENHGGRVTNLTAPNPKAQTELLIEAYQKAQIDPGTVGYIECHGTGTSLGDPIEIQALKKSFGDLYQQHGMPAPLKPHCGLSAVKTNIGHLEPAAGIASLLKVLLAMKHRQIPALLHLKELNPYVDLSGSPFYIVDKTTPWAAACAPDGTALPLRAGVSSFGWGGANAHVVLEEYIAPKPVAPVQTQAEQIVVLSAKNEERLRAYAASLLAHVRTHAVELDALAYTLQVGRDPVEERLAIVTRSIAELTEQLDRFVAAQGEVPGLYCARVARKGADQNRNDDISRGTHDMAKAWVTGAEIDWSRLHTSGERLKRLSLPTYPFARERHWIETAAAPKTDKPAARVSVLHAPEVGTVLAHPVWVDAAGAVAAPAPADTMVQHVVVLCDLPHLDIDRFRSSAPEIGQITRLALPQSLSAAERYRAAAVASFERLQAVLQARVKGKVLFQIAVGCEGADTLMAGLSGLIRSARLEQPGLIGQLVLIGDAADERTLAARLRACRAAPAEALFRCEGEQLRVLRWQEASLRAEARIAIRDRGVYLITGGLGGLGLTFAREILRQTPSARIVFTGRSPLTDEKREAIERLASPLLVPSSQLMYQSLDLNSADAVDALIKEIVNRYGALHGVIHSAGMTHDSMIVNKSAATFAEVLEPKVTGTFHLDQATSELDLDFLVLFSSVSAAMGNVGQADYATANAFMDQFAQRRNALASAGQRRGHAVSINWPLWEEGGMQIAPKARARLLEATGMLPMSTGNGLRAFYGALDLHAGQAMVMEGQVKRLRRLLFPGTARDETAASERRTAGAVARLNVDTLRQLVLADLRGFKSKGI
ncbi:polyketide synthase [Caballeronia udeis]|uniref:Polyketide synthase n=1 Tax=Caballeronia udeis TaxID=1232866 RepID=A0A158GLE8_9BURK|nr:type I polyketide synthase [Caballeronia udeis]SAL32948.1 polyketide synthase [Caballeronia udeis]